MKKLIILSILVAVLMPLLYGCRQDIVFSDKPLVIEEVKIVNEDFGKYKYVTHDSNNECVFYLDEKYSIGDTLVITRK